MQKQTDTISSILTSYATVTDSMHSSFSRLFSHGQLQRGKGFSPYSATRILRHCKIILLLSKSVAIFLRNNLD